MALLHILCSALPDSKLISVYVDHGLRPAEIKAEIELVEALARRLQSGFEMIRVDVKSIARQGKMSIEEAARALRYQALETLRQQYQGKAIAVAHTADDQAEEILIRLIRGSGRKGLSGMLYKNGWIIRPLLHEKKETLLQYLREEQIPFCTDSSNLERACLRNRIRLDLLPYLQDNFNKSIKQTMLQTAQILQDEETLLAEIADKAWQDVVSTTAIQPSSTPSRPQTPSHTIQINTQQFLRHHPAIQRRILEKCCWQMEARPQFRQIVLLLDLLNTGQTGAEIHLSQGLRAHKTRQGVVFSYPAGKCGYRGSVRGKSDRLIE